MYVGITVPTRKVLGCSILWTTKEVTAGDGFYAALNSFRAELKTYHQAIEEYRPFVGRISPRPRSLGIEFEAEGAEGNSPGFSDDSDLPDTRQFSPDATNYSTTGQNESVYVPEPPVRKDRYPSRRRKKPDKLVVDHTTNKRYEVVLNRKSMMSCRV